MDEQIKKIADHYGLENQKIKLSEECAELIQALLKNNDENHIIEEISDVEIVLEQVKYKMKCDNMVDFVKKSKINRQLNRIAREKKHD